MYVNYDIGENKKIQGYLYKDMLNTVKEGMFYRDVFEITDENNNRTRRKVFVDDNGLLYIKHNKKVIYLKDYLRLTLSEFKALERPHDSDLILMLEHEGIDNIVVWGSVPVYSMVVPGMGIAITGEKTLNAVLKISKYNNSEMTYKINLIPYFEEERKILSSESYYTSDFMSLYRKKHFVIEHINNVNLDNLKLENRIKTGKDYNFELELSGGGTRGSRKKEKYEKIDQKGMVSFFKDFETGYIYQYLPELDTEAKKEGIFRSNNNGLFKVRTDKQVNKIISKQENWTIKYDLSGKKGFMVMFNDNEIISNVWSLNEIKRLFLNEIKNMRPKGVY